MNEHMAKLKIGPHRSLTTLENSPHRELMEHYGIYDEIMKQAKDSGVDHVILSGFEHEETIQYFLKFCTWRTQRIIIDFDKDYPYFIARAIDRSYGASSETP